MSLLVKAGGGAGGIAYTGDNPLTIGQNGYTFEPKTLLKNGLTIVNGVNGEDLTDVESRQALAVADLMRVAKRKVSEARNFGDYVWKKYKPTLPDGYTQLAYIEATGTQYIDTGYVLTSENVKVEIGFEYVSLLNNSTLFGAYDGTNFAFCPYIASGAASMTFFAGTSTNLMSTPVEVGKHYDLVCTAKNKTLTVNLNGTEKSSAYSGTILTGRSLALFADNMSTNGFSQHSAIKLKYFRMYQDDVLVRSYVPSSGNSVGAYELVTNTLATNAGTGSFVAGNSVFGTFEDYVVADDENSYPDGGEQDGYWYQIYKKLPTQSKTVTPVPEGMTVTPDVGYLLEKVVLNGFSEGITPEMFGYTRMAVDKFTQSSRTVGNLNVEHSLGESPKLAIISTNTPPTTKNDIYYGFILNPNQSNTLTISGSVRLVFKTASALGTEAVTGGAQKHAITLGTTSNYYTAGVEYTLITMA